MMEKRVPRRSEEWTLVRWWAWPSTTQRTWREQGMILNFFFYILFCHPVSFSSHYPSPPLSIFRFRAFCSVWNFCVGQNITNTHIYPNLKVRIFNNSMVHRLPCRQDKIDLWPLTILWCSNTIERAGDKLRLKRRHFLLQVCMCMCVCVVRFNPASFSPQGSVHLWDLPEVWENALVWHTDIRCTKSLGPCHHQGLSLSLTHTHTHPLTHTVCMLINTSKIFFSFFIFTIIKTDY